MAVNKTSVETPSQTVDAERSVFENDSLILKMSALEVSCRGPAGPDPEKGKVRVGPGDVGLENRPKVNPDDYGIKQMSNSRLAIGLGFGAVLTILVLVIGAFF